MKKILSILSILVFALTANAQKTVYIHLSNNTDIEFDLSQVTEISFEKAENANQINFNKLINKDNYVDLGLSVKWGKMNLGATSETEEGNLYKLGYTLNGTPGYSYDDDDLLSSYFIDYKGNKGSNYDELKGLSGTQYDDATAALGGLWRTPTMSEWGELIENCTWEFIQTGTVEDEYDSEKVYPVGYYKVTSKVPGYTDNFIYIKANHYKRCWYWSANPNWVGGKRYGIAVDIPTSGNVMYTPVTHELLIRPVYGELPVQEEPKQPEE